MAHSCIIKDTDVHHFVVDPITRALATESKKLVLMKGDHNSERFTFELPLKIEDHDMSECNQVEVHFINIDSSTRQSNVGICPVDDFSADPNNQIVTCSWLLSDAVTKYAGPLTFVLRLACIDKDTGVTSYRWSTAIYSGINVLDGICNTEYVVSEYVDILQRWLTTLEEAADSICLINEDGALIDLTNQLTQIEFTHQQTDAKLAELQSTAAGLNTEITNLKNADAALSQRIDNIGSTNSTITAINNEITNLKNADTALGQRIDNIDQSDAIQTINTQIENLGKRIDSINQNGGTDYAQAIASINTEITNLKNADTDITGDISVIKSFNSEVDNRLLYVESCISPIGSILYTTRDTAPSIGEWITYPAQTSTKTFIIWKPTTDVPVLGGPGSYDTSVETTNIGFGVADGGIDIEPYTPTGANGENGWPCSSGNIVGYNPDTGELQWTMRSNTARQTVWGKIKVTFTVYAFERIG